MMNADMNARFEVEAVFPVTGRGEFVGTRQLPPFVDFSMTDASHLGGVEVENWFDIPRATDGAGKQREGVFIFKLKHPDDKSKLSVGQHVELITG
jgi:hypothetical protein